MTVRILLVVGSVESLGRHIDCGFDRLIRADRHAAKYRSNETKSDSPQVRSC